jgi:hypothetical protein
MSEAVLRTTASPAATWGIVVIMTILTAVLVGATMAADVYGVRTRKTASTPPWEDPAPGVTRDPAAADTSPPAADATAGPVLAESEAPTVPDLPACPAPPALPRQRGGEDDQAERSAAAAGSLWDILPGQRDPRP